MKSMINIFSPNILIIFPSVALCASCLPFLNQFNNGICGSSLSRTRRTPYLLTWSTALKKSGKHRNELKHTLLWSFIFQKVFLWSLPLLSIPVLSPSFPPYPCLRCVSELLFIPRFICGSDLLRDGGREGRRRTRLHIYIYMYVQQRLPTASGAPPLLVGIYPLYLY